MGSLNIYIINGTDSDKRDLLWQRSGNRGNRWRAAEVTLKSTINFQVCCSFFSYSSLIVAIKTGCLPQNGKCFYLKSKTSLKCKADPKSRSTLDDKHYRLWVFVLFIKDFNDIFQSSTISVMRKYSNNSMYCAPSQKWSTPLRKNNIGLCILYWIVQETQKWF